MVYPNIQDIVRFVGTGAITRSLKIASSLFLVKCRSIVILQVIRNLFRMGGRNGLPKLRLLGSIGGIQGKTQEVVTIFSRFA